MESSPTDGLRLLHINNVSLAHSGEVQLVVTHPGKPHSTLKAYTTLTVIPKSSPTIHKNDEEPSTPIQTTTTTASSSEEQSRETTTTAKDRLQQPACILEGPQDCTALIGGCVRLSVIYEGLPKPQVVWYKAVSTAHSFNTYHSTYIFTYMYVCLYLSIILLLCLL